MTVDLWHKLLKIGQSQQIKPAGLACRDILRIEAGYSLYGHELSNKIHILESGLHWIIDLNKPDFIGKEAIVDKKSNDYLPQKIVGLQLQQKAIPRRGYEVKVNDEIVGYITSGCILPKEKAQGIALALLNILITNLREMLISLLEIKPFQLKLLVDIFIELTAMPKKKSKKLKQTQAFHKNFLDSF